MKHKESVHNTYLDDLINNLRDVDENIYELSWIMKDGIWLQYNKSARLKMPDIIAKYQDNGYLLMELKGSKNKRKKAIAQLQSGEMFVKQNFNPDYIIQKFVTYSPIKGYEYEIIKQEDNLNEKLEKKYFLLN